MSVADTPSGSGHAWNELILDDDTRVIVDVMNPRPEFAFLTGIRHRGKTLRLRKKRGTLSPQKGKRGSLTIFVDSGTAALRAKTSAREAAVGRLTFRPEESIGTFCQCLPEKSPFS